MNISQDIERPVVYILGAGASKAVIPDAPLMDRLLPEALKLFKQPNYSEGHWGRRIRRINGFFKDFYKLNLDTLEINPDALPITFPNLEDILTQLDDAIIEDRPLSRRYNLPCLRRLREDLVYAICEVLREKLDFGEVNGRELMRRFMHRLRPDDSILSLNYDIIVDNALYLFRRSSPVDYGLSIRYALEKNLYVDIKPEPYKLPNESQRNLPPLYKLHGSLNWLYCPSCQQLDVTMGEKGVRYIYEEDNDFACPDCQGRYDPLIITPTLLKTYNNILLREVWRQAEDKVSKADEVVFIGYSLPDADVQLRCMLKRALFRNRNKRGGTSTCKICVVSKSPPDDERHSNETHRRYMKQFVDVEYYADGFQGYIEQLDR
jgi:hypothetical protein